MRSLSLQEILSLAARLLTERRTLWQNPKRSLDEIRAWQFARIGKLVQHAYENVPFYKDIYSSIGFQPGDLKTWEDFKSLPVITKDQVIANYPHNMLARGESVDELVISRSSGSSGKVLDIAYDSRAMGTYILAGLRLYEMGFSYRPWHRQLYVYTSPYPLDSLFGLYPMKFVPTLAPVQQIIDQLLAYKPRLLVCYPSHLKQIAQEMTPLQRRSIGLRCISVNSEMSTQKERNALSEMFGCPVLDEYSSEELTRIAAQCRQKKYHVFEDINYLETLDEAGAPTSGQGVLVGTNLHNFAMPMIRYKQNDLVTIENCDCPCGWHFRQITNLQGRKNDNFIMPSGKILSSGFLLDATYDMILTYRDAVRDFCLIQDTATTVRLQVIPDAGWTEAIAALLQTKFVSFFEPTVTFAIEQVEVCEKTRTGKRNPIISHVCRGLQH